MCYSSSESQLDKLVVEELYGGGGVSAAGQEGISFFLRARLVV
jgi:hypothetical protein